MANTPVAWAPVVVGAVGLITNLLVEVVVHQYVAGIGLQVLVELILTAHAQCPAVHRLKVVAGSHVGFKTHAPVAVYLLLGFGAKYQSAFALCKCRGAHKQGRQQCDYAISLHCDFLT